MKTYQVYVRSDDKEPWMWVRPFYLGKYLTLNQAYYTAKNAVDRGCQYKICEYEKRPPNEIRLPDDYILPDKYPDVPKFLTEP